MMPPSKGGLLSSTAMTPPGAPQAAGAAPPPGQDGRAAAAPEEQEVYDQFVGKAVQLMVDDRLRPGLMQRIKSGDPVEGLATAAVMVVDRIRDAASKAGQQIPDDVLLSGGAEIIAALAQLAEKDGVHAYTPDEVQSAGLRAVDMFRESHMQEFDEGSVMEGFNEMMQADQDGTLAQALGQGGGQPAGPAAPPAAAVPPQGG